MSMNEPKKSNQIDMAYRLLEVLAGHEFDPLRNKDIATALRTSAPQVTRYLQQAELCGWVERTPDDRWRLAPGKLTNIAVSVQHGIQRARSRFEDQANNLTRSPY